MVTFRPFIRRNSLFSDFRSLLSKFFSLLICVGNCAKSRCGTRASCREIGF
jgi:hypothetical protein